MFRSEDRALRKAEKEAEDIRKTFRQNGRMTASQAKEVVKHGRDEDGYKAYGRVKGGKTPPTPSKAEQKRMVKQAKQAEKKIKRGTLKPEDGRWK